MRRPHPPHFARRLLSVQTVAGRRGRCKTNSLKNVKHPKKEIRLGIISDTHGYLDPQIFEIFHGVDHILHAGDLGTEDVVIDLETIAPLTAVSGNVDAHLPRSRFPEVKFFEAGPRRFLVVHVGMSRNRPASLVTDLLRQRPADLVVFGHSHQPYFGQLSGCYFLNPGSAGKKRFTLPRTVVRLDVEGPGSISGAFFSLEKKKEDERSFWIEW